MPEGIQQAEIDPTTGELATAESLAKRTELFINGTLPTTTSEEAAQEEPTPEGEQPADPDLGMEPQASPEPSPTASPHAKATPKTEDELSPRLEGTITLDIDPSTGLIAVETCPVIRTRTFVIGTEPKKYCGPEYHRSKNIDQSGMRPRVVATPPR